MAPLFKLPQPEIVAKPVQPDAAIAFWQSRAAMTREQAKALAEGERWRAFCVSGLAQHDMAQTVKDAIGEALAHGETLASFKKRIGSVIEKTGWTSHRVENIFRTNMQTAYAAGRYAKMQAVKATRPYWQYITVEDRRVRPSHSVLHGMVFHADDEFWATNYPPNGFRCRCTVRTLSERQLKRKGLTVQNGPPGSMLYTDPTTGMEYHVASPGADKGFANNPGKDWVESTLQLATDKLEKASPELTAATIRSLAKGGLAQWTKKPKGNFPLAVLTKEDANSIGATATVAHISPETWKKQAAHHPELTLADYWLAQDVVERGERIQRDNLNIIFVRDEAGGMLVVVKATAVGDELYITSLRRMSRKDKKRKEEIKRLIKQQGK